MAKHYLHPILKEDERGHLTHFNCQEITFTVKTNDRNGNPVLKCFDAWGNHCYVKGTEAYKYDHCYDKYVASVDRLYRFKSCCPEMDRLQAHHIQKFAETFKISIEEAVKAMENWDGNIWKFSRETIRIAKGAKL